MAWGPCTQATTQAHIACITEHIGGQQCPTVAAKLAAGVGPDGFWEADATQSCKPGQGLFAAGTARGPKGIADSMACAGQTTSKVLAYLSEVSR